MIRARAFAPNGPALTLLASLWLVAAANLPFWQAAWRAVGGLRADNALFVLSLPLAVLAWTYLLLGVLAWGRAGRIVLGTAMLLSATAGYFAHAYGTLIDAGMIENALQTHTAEARDLMSWRMWAWILAFGALPALWVARVRVRALPWRRELAVKALGMALAAATLGAIAFANFPHYAALLRNHRELRFLLAPHNVAAAAYGYLRQRFRASGALALEPVGADAARAIATRAERPRLTFLVIGETARAENFSLNGYGRPTTPELARRDVLSFTDVRACGTSTAVSLPCMFLDVGRAGFSAGLAQRRENLLDVLQRAGVSVLWRENNSGCKGICDRVPRHDAAALRVPELCAGGECLDEVLLNGLQEHLDRLEGDAIVVLHMTGSHGPAYFRRYPPAFEVFAPACGTVELDRCPRESVLNAYDNSIRYTDYVLGRMIDLLRDNARRFDAGLLYVSDHGESLGENGLYLHGMPYALAPRQQTQVPMVLWLSEGLRRRMEIDMTCLASRAHETRSHDDLFHSVLGLHEVRTTAYRPERDLLRPCRPAAAPTHVVAR